MCLVARTWSTYCFEATIQMRIERGSFRIDFARELVEEVLAAAAKAADAHDRDVFRQEKAVIDGIEIVDIREERLNALDLHWMEQFHISDSFERVLGSHPGLEDSISECVLRLARSTEDEKAFLYASHATLKRDDKKPVLVVQLMAASLLSIERLRELLAPPLTNAQRQRS